MTWLFVQLWLLMLIAFGAGSLVTWLVVRRLLPREEQLRSETGANPEGIFG